MKITLKEAVDNFRKQWRWIADETERQGRKVEKWEYFSAHGIDGFNTPTDYCYLCEFTIGLPCDNCIVEWGGKIGECCNRDAIADNENLYAQWLITDDWKEAARFAREIAELPLKERYKEEYERSD